MLDLEFAQLSDPGLVRDHNEDYLGYWLPPDPNGVRDRGWMFALADGVGGHDRGEVASELAVNTIISGFQASAPGQPLNSLLPTLIARANEAVYEAAMNIGPGRSSMATTVVSCALRFDRAVIAHVGDSRCYLVHRGRAAALTKDHTVPNEQLRMGLVSAREAAAAQTAHVLTRSVGSELFVNADVSETQVVPGDVLLLCSDGLHNSVGSEDIGRVVHPTVPLDAAASELVTLAKVRDGKDNVSVQLIRIRDVEAVGMYRGRQYKLR